VSESNGLLTIRNDGAWRHRSRWVSGLRACSSTRVTLRHRANQRGDVPRHCRSFHTAPALPSHHDGKPCGCLAMTVSGVTDQAPGRDSVQTRERTTHPAAVARRIRRGPGAPVALQILSQRHDFELERSAGTHRGSQAPRGKGAPARWPSSVSMRQAQPQGGLLSTQMKNLLEMPGHGH
jgi:hypothetical protein